MAYDPLEKRTAVDIMAVGCGYQMIARPRGILSFNDMENILSLFLLPAIYIIFRYQRTYICKTAAPASHAGLRFVVGHECILTFWAI